MHCIYLFILIYLFIARKTSTFSSSVIKVEERSMDCIYLFTYFLCILGYVEDYYVILQLRRIWQSISTSASSGDITVPSISRSILNRPFRAENGNPLVRIPPSAAPSYFYFEFERSVFFFFFCELFSLIFRSHLLLPPAVSPLALLYHRLARPRIVD
jgi:hypothetical protein